MISFGRLKKEASLIDEFRNTLQNSNINLLKEVDKYFKKHSGFEIDCLNKFFIEHSFIYDTIGKRFEYYLYNSSIDDYIKVLAYPNSIIFECGNVALTKSFEFGDDYTEEDIREKVAITLNSGSKEFVQSLQQNYKK